MLEQVRDVLYDKLGVEPEKVTRSADLRDDLELDSLDLVELVAVLEDGLGRKLDGAAVESIRTVGDVVDAITAAGGR